MVPGSRLPEARQGADLVLRAIRWRQTMPAPRAPGTMTVAGRTFSVSQAGEGMPEPSNCEYSVAPIAFAPCMAGGRVTASLTTQANWTDGRHERRVAVAAEWQIRQGHWHHCDRVFRQLRLPARGHRDGAVADADGRPEPSRRAGRLSLQHDPVGVQLHIRGRERQLLGVPGGVPNSCGGALQDRCVWTARSNVSWITVTSSMPQQGDHPVSFTWYPANTSGSARNRRPLVSKTRS